jgi:hypothetical protein
VDVILGIERWRTLTYLWYRYHSTDPDRTCRRATLARRMLRQLLQYRRWAREARWDLQDQLVDASTLYHDGLHEAGSASWSDSSSKKYEDAT